MAWNLVHAWGPWYQWTEDPQKKKKKRLNSGDSYQPEKKYLCSHESHTSARLPPSKFLLVPGIQNQLMWIFPDSDWIQAEFWSLKRYPLLNHILTIHWGRLCWKKNYYPTFTCLFFVEKKFTCTPFLTKAICTVILLYIKINNFPLI